MSDMRSLAEMVYDPRNACVHQPKRTPFPSAATPGSAHPRHTIYPRGAQIMFALIALICFVLALFEVDIAGLNLMILGLCFIALHLLFGDWRPWTRPRRP